MPTARKLPSGSWRCRVTYTENGKRYSKSFTVDDPSPKGKRRCEQIAADYQSTLDDGRIKKRMTFGDAAREYVDIRKTILSPTTINSYESYMKCHLTPLMDKPLDDIDNRMIQRVIGSIKLSSKTVRNVYGFISAVMGHYRPHLRLRIDLPKKYPSDIYVPSNDEIKALLTAVQGTALELPVLLAVLGPMRRGEICALHSDDINGNIVHVRRNKVRKIVDGKMEWVIKQPKSAAGDRFIQFPDFVGKKLSHVDGYVTNMNPDTLTNEFRRFLIRHKLPVFRFHDMRHFSASFQHALGIPDAYVMQRGGWGNDRTLKAVYRHTLTGTAKTENDRLNTAFSDIFGQ